MLGAPYNNEGCQWREEQLMVGDNIVSHWNDVDFGGRKASTSEWTICFRLACCDGPSTMVSSRPMCFIQLFAATPWFRHCWLATNVVSGSTSVGCSSSCHERPLVWHMNVWRWEDDDERETSCRGERNIV